MSNAPVEFVANDTGSALVITAKKQSDRTVIVLTGSTVRLRYSISGATTQVKTMTITDAVNGVAQYQFLTGELIAGTMKGEIEITDSTSKITTSVVPFVVEVRAKI